MIACGRYSGASASPGTKSFRKSKRTVTLRSHFDVVECQSVGLFYVVTWGSSVDQCPQLCAFSASVRCQIHRCLVIQSRAREGSNLNKKMVGSHDQSSWSRRWTGLLKR